ncbi:hypothetical protein K1719_022850 [Acacia pycnantha]|nr:hypothetical protein K1719_022850 [Acacia pycnantha]
MGRGRVQLKRIENKINRQVTFSKRRVGLTKKAHEISVLCDAEVALIVFNLKGKLFEYASDSCMEKTLERYEKYNYAEMQLTGNHSGTTQENWIIEYSRLKARIDLMERNQRNYMGEDLASLSLKELQSLEQQLETAIKHIRTRKNQLMSGSISELQKKERMIQEENSMLTKKIKESEKAATAEAQKQAQWEQPNHHAAAPNHSFLLPHPLPTVITGGNYVEEETSVMERNDLDLTLEPILFFVRTMNERTLDIPMVLEGDAWVGKEEENKAILHKVGVFLPSQTPPLATPSSISCRTAAAAHQSYIEIRKQGGISLKG